MKIHRRRIVLTIPGILAWGLAASICGLGACRSVGSADLQAGRERVERLIEAYNRLDLDAAVACFALDGSVGPPRGVEVRGREAVRAYYARLFANWRPVLRVEHLETVSDHGEVVDRGRVIGGMEPVATAAPKPVYDEFEARLVLEEGDWRVALFRWRPRGS